MSLRTPQSRCCESRCRWRTVLRFLPSTDSDARLAIVNSAKSQFATFVPRQSVSRYISSRVRICSVRTRFARKGVCMFLCACVCDCVFVTRTHVHPSSVAIIFPSTVTSSRIYHTMRIVVYIPASFVYIFRVAGRAQQKVVCLPIESILLVGLPPTNHCTLSVCLGLLVGWTLSCVFVVCVCLFTASVRSGIIFLLGCAVLCVLPLRVRSHFDRRANTVGQNNQFRKYVII